MLGLAMTLLLAGQAPRAEPAAPDGIVVTGQRMDAAEARNHVSDITPTVQGQLARFRAPVCPQVIGMGTRQAAVVVDRIRAVAAQAGIPAAAPDCQPNLSLIVTPNGRHLIEEVRRRRPSVFAGLSPVEMRRLLRAAGPVRVWRTTELLNEDGFMVSHITGALTIRSASIISQPTQQATLQSVVVIDDAAADGKSLGQLADYAVMRTLAGARAPRNGAGGGDTILALFAPNARTPPALTPLDMAYLSALYRSAPNQGSMQQMARISTMIARGLAAPEEPAETGAPSP